MKKAFILSVLLSSSFLAIVPSHHMLLAQQALMRQEQKEIIEKIVVLLRDNYLFPEKAKEIGLDLQKKANDRKYEKLADPQAFAKQLTSDLQDFSHDKHLTIEYDPQRVKELKVVGSNPTNDAVMEIEKKRYERQRRDNFGFRKVEVLEGNVGYLDLRYFGNADYSADIAIGAMSFLANSDAIIIDLRDNYGGGAPMYLLLISYFFNSDMIHLSDTINRLSNSTQQLRARPYVPGKRLPDVDLYILTSGRTFSAAEQFTYDLQCQKRATIVGRTTGGGAHMTTAFIINNDFYAFVPFAGAINPITKTNWEGVGIIPDVEVPEGRAFDVAYLMALKKIEKKTADQDWKGKILSLINRIEVKKDI